LVVVVLTYWVAGTTTAALSAAALLLTHQAAPGFIWGWGNLLAAIALARSAPAGRLARLAGAYRSVSFALLALALAPFLWGEVRHAIYPQLDVFAERAQLSPPIVAKLSARTAGFAEKLDMPPAPPPAAASLAASPIQEVVVSGERLERRSARTEHEME